MNAVSYLVSRKATNPYKISAGLFSASILAGLNFQGALWLDQSNYGVGWVSSSLVLITGMAAWGLGIGTFIIGPFQYLSQLTGTIQRFSENRILAELTSTGLSTRTILNQLLAYYLKRVAIISIPSGLLWFLYLGQFELLGLAAVWVLTIGLLYLVAACLTCWRVAVGSRGMLLLIAPLVFLFGPPTILLQTVGDGPQVWMASFVFLMAASYMLSLRALDSRNDFQNTISKLRKALRLRRKSVHLSENAIVARQEAVGREWGDVFALAISVLALLLAMMFALTINAQWPVLNILLISGFIAASRCATKLSQSLTSELEGSTLELLRTTPLGSQRFLKGWLDLTLKPVFVELGVLCTAAFGFAITAFPESLVDGTFAYCIFLTIAMPYVGALFGASIAGQLKTRTEISGQLTLILFLCGVFTIPQASMLLVLDEPLWMHLLLTLGLAKMMCWLLKSGATKSLNRVFLPQK
jgi:hypothetical protein